MLQTDYNGKTENIKTVAATTEQRNEGILPAKLLIAPNPFNNVFTAEFESTAGEEVMISLLNTEGIMVYSEKMITGEGKNIFHFSLVKNHFFINGFY